MSTRAKFTAFKENYSKSFMEYERRNILKELKKEVMSDDSMVLVLISVVALLGVLYFSHQADLFIKSF